MHRLQNKINAMGLKEKVIFSGRVTDDELLEAYQHCGVFVMPSRVEYDGHTDSWAGEGFGLVYVEAEACGRPVVCSADGGAAETIIDGKTGLLVDPRSPLKVAEAIARILGDPEFADKLGRAGREHAVSSHSFDRFKLRIAEMLIADK
jgi:phosphatidylinositol alpha-1,6-mannosyltransferase